jgi:multidrug efflux system outer membrane protein
MRHSKAAASTAALGAVALVLSGCSLAPDYQRPAMAVPAAYKEVPAGWQSAQTSVAPLPQTWWTEFGDPVLTDLEGRIEAANPSLAGAVARYGEALGQLGVSRADLFPTATIGGSAERAHSSDYAPVLHPGGTGNDYTIQGSLSYEIDLFGRIRNQVRANRGQAEASDADVRGIRLGLQSELAQTYFQLRGADARLELLADTVNAYQRAYDLTVARHNGGVGSGLDTSRARTQLSSARAEISDTRAQRQTYEHAIAALVGVTPAELTIAPIRTPLPAPPATPSSLPSTLLQQRPDIAAAERRSYAANRQIGVARAALFPSLDLGAAGGFESGGAHLISTAASFWMLGPAMAALTVFDAGRNRSKVRIARAQFDEAAANYRQTVLTAFKEVEDDLVTNRDLAQEALDQSDATKSAERTQQLALIRYRDGASDYLEVVTAQTAALDAERSLLELRTRQLTTAVDTVRALGGATQP